jgi:4-hydroxythreonine-4-phosphate dehydrogenase
VAGEVEEEDFRAVFLKPICISIGDITGIGPEVSLKALAAEIRADDARYVLIGDEAHLHDLNRSLGIGLSLGVYPGGCDRGTARGPEGSEGQDHLSAGVSSQISILSPWAPLPPQPPQWSAAVASAAVEWVREGAVRCLSGEFSAMVTAPVNKEAIVRAGHSFIGQTEMLSEIAVCGRTAMMLLGTDAAGRWLRVVLATTHVPIREVSDKLTTEKVALAIELASQSCRELRLPRARVAVCGLNPHAGEGGKMGTEELTTITPAVVAMRKQGLDVHGPFSADALFHYVYRGDYDVVVAMYHDQGLVPLKMVAFEQGINWTLGLPFVRTSPDHGTAYDIAGQGKADASSMIAALRLAKQLAAK